MSNCILIQAQNTRRNPLSYLDNTTDHCVLSVFAYSTWRKGHYKAILHSLQLGNLEWVLLCLSKLVQSVFMVSSNSVSCGLVDSKLSQQAKALVMLDVIASLFFAEVR